MHKIMITIYKNEKNEEDAEMSPAGITTRIHEICGVVRYIKQALYVSYTTSSYSDLLQITM